MNSTRREAIFAIIRTAFAFSLVSSVSVGCLPGLARNPRDRKCLPHTRYKSRDTLQTPIARASMIQVRRALPTATVTLRERSGHVLVGDRALGLWWDDRAWGWCRHVPPLLVLL